MSNKIPIHKLLNPSTSFLDEIQKHETSDQSIKLNDFLLSIIIQLSKIFNRILDGGRIDSEAICERLEEFLNIIKKLPTSVTKNDYNFLFISNIGKILNTLDILVKDDLFICQTEQKIVKQLKVPVSSSRNKSKGGVTFKMLTKNAMNGNARFPNKGQRLPKVYTTILENWYQENIRNPYLNDHDLQTLMRKCSLERSQVKNWIANRRRKDRNAKISPALSSILKKFPE